MGMNMYMIMNMNIYFNKRNTDWLTDYQKKGGSKSALLNSLLEKHIATGASVVLPPRNFADDTPPATRLETVGYASKKDVEKIKSGETTVLSDKPTAKKNIALATPTQADDGFEFCKHGQVKGFCKKGCK